MINNILKYLIMFVMFGVGNYNLQTFFLKDYDISLSYNLLPIYVFAAVSSFLIVLLMEMLALSEKLKNQRGFIYLATLLIKLMCFVGLFYESIFSEVELTKTDSFNLLIPLLFFLFIEVFVSSKIINKN